MITDLEKVQLNLRDLWKNFLNEVQQKTSDFYYNNLDLVKEELNGELVDVGNFFRGIYFRIQDIYSSHFQKNVLNKNTENQGKGA